MRPIKFRVRNQHTKEIEAIEYLDENGVWWYIRTGESQKYQGVLLGGYLREQFTGLLDKNGKECWEGDKLKSGKNIGVVEFKDGCFTVNWGDNPEFLNDILANQLPTSEITGNIYEN